MIHSNHCRRIGIENSLRKNQKKQKNKKKKKKKKQKKTINEHIITHNLDLNSIFIILYLI